MKFETYFRVTSYAMIASAFAALTLTGELDALSIALYSFALAACFYVDTKGIMKWRLREWMWRLLTAFYIPFMLFDGIALSNKILALVHLSLFASAAKLYQNKSDRDWVFLYLIAFFQMLLAAAMTFNSSFVASLIAFLFFFISTLAAFEIRRTRRGVARVQEEVITAMKPAVETSARRAVVSDGAAKKVRRVRYLVAASLMQALVIIALTLPFFFMIPRFNSGNVGGGMGEARAMTGFSDTVELGKVADIKQNRRIVMRVGLDRQPQRYLRWRGKVLEHYDGRAWKISSQIPQKDRSSAADFYESNALNVNEKMFNFSPPLFETSGEENQLVQKIDLAPLNTDALFATRTAPVVVLGPFSRVYRDRYTGALTTAASVLGRTQYTVKSTLSSPSLEELRGGEGIDYPGDVTKLYTQTPRPGKGEVPLDPRVRRLAIEVTAHARTPYDKAKAVEDYLKTEFTYSLSPKMSGIDPLGEFLFDIREGHCEYFATAMVMLLRSINIPARIVNGFQMGEFNDLNNSYTVRESDAHSWVEVYFPVRETKVVDKSSSPAVRTEVSGYWIEFDPTPPAGINDYSQGGMAATLRKYMDAMEVFWLDYVVTLDQEEQASMLVDLQRRLVALKNAALRYYRATVVWIKSTINALMDAGNWTLAKTVRLAGGVLAVGALCFGVYVGLLYRKRRKLAPTGYNPWWYRLFVAPLLRLAHRKKRDHQASAVLFYEQMLAIAARAGLVKQPGQTPLEFATAARFPEIREITRVYNRVRFGGAALEEAETRKISELLSELKRAVAAR